MLALDIALASEWAMEENAIRGVLAIAAREHEATPQALEAYRAKALERAERAKVRDGVAILNVEGPMFKKANLMTELCGATSYETLRRDLQAAVDDGSVRAILLNVDSPGGEARGVGELATAVKAVRGVKPIVAYAGDLAASAAYWIASAADKIVIGEGAALGSIGVRAAYSDTSDRDAARGVKTVEFVSSQSPYKTADINSKDGRERIQARVDALADVFVNAVAANRDASRAYVLERFGRGDVLIGKAALAAGMADDFGTFESVFAGLAGRLSSGGKGNASASRSRVAAEGYEAAQTILTAFAVASGSPANGTTGSTEQTPSKANGIPGADEVAAQSILSAFRAATGQT